VKCCCFLTFYIYNVIYIFFYLRGCPGQLARTTTNPTAHWTSCKPSEHVRYRGDDKHAQRSSKPVAEKGNNSLPPLGQDLKCYNVIYLYYRKLDNSSFSLSLILGKNINILRHSITLMKRITRRYSYLILMVHMFCILNICVVLCIKI
jgi:hypothetical protein